MPGVSSLRFGFATNSSSSHSIIILPDQSASNDYGGGGEFGWDFFTASGHESKRRYGACMLRRALGEVIPESAAFMLTQACFPEHQEEDYVDHQSTWVIPCYYGTNFPSMDFARDATAFLSRPDVVILGGNDNAEDAHPLRGSGKVAPHFPALPSEAPCSDYVCRRNDRGDWTVFGRKNGTKIRIAFGATDQALGGKPELVDVKITDYCPYGCPNCYMDSTHGGKTADLKAAEALAYQLGKAKVFEVAIGGGEPTMVPNFREFVRAFRRQGLSVSFTTRNLRFLQREDWWRDECRGVGVSLPVKPDERHPFVDAVALLSAELGSSDWPYTRRVALHVVPGMLGVDELGSLMRKASERSLRMLLLGWKAAGRAGSSPPRDEVATFVGAMAAAKTLPQLGIDTELAATLSAAGLLKHVPSTMYETKDGTSSWYYDLVAMRQGPSSYGETLAVLKPTTWGQPEFVVPDVPLSSPITEAAVT